MLQSDACVAHQECLARRVAAKLTSGADPAPA